MSQAAAEAHALAASDHPSDLSQGHHHDAGTGHGHPPHLAHHFETPEQQFSTGKLGMWTFLATEILMFGGLFCGYAVYRANHPEIFAFAHKALDTTLGAVNTAVLIASSFTMAWGVRAAQLNQQKLLRVLLFLTLLGGFGFLGIKTVEYASKWDHGLFAGPINAFNSKLPEYVAGDDKTKAVRDVRDGAIHYIESHGAGAPAGTTGHGADHADPPSVSGKAGAHGSAAPAGAHDSEGTAASSASARVESTEGHGDPQGGMTAAQPGSGSSTGQNTSADVTKSGDAPGGAAGEEHGTHAQPHDDHPATQPTGVMYMDPHAGTNDAAKVQPPLFVPSGPIKTGEAHAAHAGVTYSELEQADRTRVNAFFQIYYAMTGLHALHVVIGMAVLAWLLGKAMPKPIGHLVSPLLVCSLALVFVWAWVHMGTSFGKWYPALLYTAGGTLATGLVFAGAVWYFMGRDTTGGDFSPEYFTPVDLGGLYWHLVDLIWIFLFPLLYLIH